ncbi:hypothetical protein EYF80_047947 [Liparis tanakae]|uniref:Uncharacterized protein n=1 Tax=Liparis tanakae TaxID=230148 RepID=A0A4Z2FLX1_9TELE|nr:hypothetical protein EYF80_047947 [Liparis tanakae]
MQLYGRTGERPRHRLAEHGTAAEDIRCLPHHKAGQWDPGAGALCPHPGAAFTVGTTPPPGRTLAMRLSGGERGVEVQHIQLIQRGGAVLPGERHRARLKIRERLLLRPAGSGGTRKAVPAGHVVPRTGQRGLEMSRAAAGAVVYRVRSGPQFFRTNSCSFSTSSSALVLLLLPLTSAIIRGFNTSASIG